MVKMIVIGKSKSGWSQEDYSKYWYEQHGPLFAATFPMVKRYVQNHALDLGKGRPPIDGIGEFWFDDMESFTSFGKLYKSPAGKPVRDDEDKLIDKSTLSIYVCEERVIKSVS
jgi:uncharacterized protein (TIGR02118 family)